MAIISPFKGIRYNTEKINDLALVTTPPYDVISSTDQQRYYDIHENNIIRIELGKDYEGDNENNNKYIRAGSYLNEWIRKGVLVQEELPAIYIYDQEFHVSEWEVKRRRGLITLVKLSEFSEGIVLPHEHTLSKAKVDRFNLMCTTNSNISQIFSLYNDNQQVVPLLDKYTISNPPEISFANPENVIERLWVITDVQLIAEICTIFSGKQLFIADGHHRYETALNYRKKTISENLSHTGNELYNYVMMTLVDMDDPGLVVFPTHRVLKNLPKFDSKSFIEFAESIFEVKSIKFNTSFTPEYVPDQIRISVEQNGVFGKSFGYYDGSSENYYILMLKDQGAVEKALPDKSPAYKDLDVTVLHSLILEQYFKIDEDNQSKQINLSYTRDIKEAMDWVASRKCQCAFFLNPTQVRQVKEVSLAGDKMPQKSTYFYPKVSTGLVINKFR